MSDSVTVYRATYGAPATVVIVDGGREDVAAFDGGGHVFTANADARAYAEQWAPMLGVDVVWAA